MASSSREEEVGVRVGAGIRSGNGTLTLGLAHSVWEIIGQADGGLSVLRTFRLLRVLKLVRFMPALRRQLVVLMKTMDNVATFCMLLMLFIFIFRCASCRGRSPLRWPVHLPLGLRGGPGLQKLCPVPSSRQSRWDAFHAQACHVRPQAGLFSCGLS